MIIVIIIMIIIIIIYKNDNIAIIRYIIICYHSYMSFHRS